MIHPSEKDVLEFFRLVGFPGIRFGEKDEGVQKYLKSYNYNFTPDLIAGPEEITEATVEGLFFIDVNEPTSDLLFNSEFYKQYEIDVPRVFKDILKKNSQEKIFTCIDMLPTFHHFCYLNALNKKLNKYSHKRKYSIGERQLVSANLGLVHHFNLGIIQEGCFTEVRKIITLLDYLRFYKRLSIKNDDLNNAGNLLLQELLNENQVDPYLLFIGREWKDVPIFFYLVHISVIKQQRKCHLALFILNTTILDACDKSYPIIRWFEEIIFNPKTQKYPTDAFDRKNIMIKIGNDEDLFT